MFAKPPHFSSVSLNKSPLQLEAQLLKANMCVLLWMDKILHDFMEGLSYYVRGVMFPFGAGFCSSKVWLLNMKLPAI